MKFTLSWLQDHLDIKIAYSAEDDNKDSHNLSLKEFADRMTMAGLEVETIENMSEILKDFSVAHVLEAFPHPNADKLKVCRVMTKDGEKQIVCGAENAKTGLWGIYAPVGSYIPGLDMTLGKAVIRGVESYGMLCSELEINSGDEHGCIIEIRKNAFQKIGLNVAYALEIEDPVIDFEVTPNRPDWLSIRGIARDLFAAGLGKLNSRPELKKPAFSEKFNPEFRIRTKTDEMCPLLMGRVIRGIKNDSSPEWLQKRLRAIGLRPVNAVVDITNFVTYDRARPLHAYDLTYISGSISARKGQKGESFKALDGKTYHVDDTMCVIADEKKVLGLGGIIGGELSSMQTETRDIFLESAYFDPISIAHTGRKTGCISDARYRFERGVDPEYIQSGLDLATQMILEICGGEASSIMKDGHFKRKKHLIEFPLSQVKRITGIEIAKQDILNILEKLGFQVNPKSKIGQNKQEKEDIHLTNASIETLRVEVPSWRKDVKGKADLVEEIIRIYGYHHLESTQLPKSEIKSSAFAYDWDQSRIRLAKHVLASRHYLEAITWSFCKKERAKIFGGGQEELTLLNPISSELDCMRPSVLIHLIEAVQRNRDKGFEHVSLFETGHIYLSEGQGKKPVQKRVISGVKTQETKRHWQGNITPDIYTIKADIYALIEALGGPVLNLSLSDVSRPVWHPGRSASLKLGPKNLIAEFGELHPGILKQIGYEGRLLAFEIFLDMIPKPRQKTAKPVLEVSEFMPLKRDFAFIIEHTIPVDQLIKAIRSVDKKQITEISVFDVYEGEHIEKDKKSIAIEVMITPNQKTLTDKEIKEVSDRIVRSVYQSTGAILRK